MVFFAGPDGNFLIQLLHLRRIVEFLDYGIHIFISILSLVFGERLSILEHTVVSHSAINLLYQLSIHINKISSNSS